MVADQVLDGVVSTLSGPEVQSRVKDVDGSGQRRKPALVELTSQDPAEEFTRILAEFGLGDGFPFVPPTVDRVDETLRMAGIEADELIWPAIPPRLEPLTAQDVAVIATMAGCRATSLPIVITAYKAMGAADFRLPQAAITTHPSGTLVLISGPSYRKFGLASGPGCLGPGLQANATIGRAVALAYSVCLGARTGGNDLSLQGSPAEYSYCCAENLEESPWQGLHADLMGPDDTTVTVLKCEGPHNIIDNISVTPDSLLTTIASTASTLGSNNTYNPGSQTVVFLNPEHAAIIARASWTKERVREFLFNAITHDRAELEGRGFIPQWPDSFLGLGRVPIVERADDILIVVVGAPGPQSQVALPWGRSRGVTLALDSRWVEPVAHDADIRL